MKKFSFFLFWSLKFLKFFFNFFSIQNFFSNYFFPIQIAFHRSKRHASLVIFKNPFWNWYWNFLSNPSDVTPIGGFLFSFHFMVFGFPATFFRTSFSLQKSFPISPNVFLLTLQPLNSSFVVPNCLSKCPIWQQIFCPTILWWVHNRNFCGCTFGCEHFTSARNLRQDYNCEPSFCSEFLLQN